MENPPEPTEKLKKAMRDYRRDLVTKVTSDNFGELLIKSAEEALEYTKDEQRYCYYCRRDTLTIEEDCIKCELSKPYKNEE